MVFIFLATGFEEIEATTTIDIIRRAGIDVKIVSTTGEKTVTGAHNISLSADLLFEDADFSKAKMLILPGGLPGTTNLEKHEGLLSLIRKQNQAGKWIAAICAAPSILGKMHLLRNLDATCYPGFEHLLNGASYQDEKVVCDDKFVLANGPSSALLWALAIVREELGAEKSDSVAAGMLFYPVSDDQLDNIFG